MVDNEILREFDGTLNLRPIIKPLAIVAGTAVVTLFGSMWIVSKLYATRSFDNIALRQEMNSKDGYTGVASGLESLKNHRSNSQVRRICIKRNQAQSASCRAGKALL